MTSLALSYFIYFCAQMMNEYSLPYSMIMWAPFYITIGCFLIISFCIFHKGVIQPAIRNVLLLFFSAIITNWLCFNMVFHNPAESLPFLPFFYFSVMVLPVALYHLVVLITRTSSSDHFSWKHYILPVSIAIIAFVLSFSVPYNMEAFKSMGDDDKFIGSESFIFFHKAVFLLRVFLAIGYFIPIMRRIQRYHKVVANYSSNEERGGIRWLSAFMYTFLFQAIAPLIAIIIGFRNEHSVFSGPLMPLMAILIIWQNVLLTYNALLGNFVSMSSEINMEQEEKEEVVLYEKIHGEEEDKMWVFKSRLEEYMQQEKPYLKDDLKITDLARALSTNRTYLSSFINNAYNKNFCQFVNDYRVAAYEVLKEKNQDAKINELIELCGFSNYKAYQRAKQARDKQI